MRMGLLSGNRGIFLSLLELVLALGIVLFLAYKAYNAYFKKPAMDKDTEQALSQQGIDTSNYSTIVNSARRQVQDINKRLMKRTDALDAIK